MKTSISGLTAAHRFAKFSPMISGGISFGEPSYRPPDGRAPHDLDVVPGVLLTPPDYPVDRMMRTEAGLILDQELVKLAGMDHRCRVVQARLTRRMMQMRGWNALGFVRLSDYARERLGCAARSLEEDARVMKSLDSLPRLLEALESASLSWTQVRLLARAATPDTEEELLERAASLTTRELEAFLRERDAQPASNAEDSGGDVDGPGLPSEEHSGEPEVRWTTAVSRTGVRMWRSVCEIGRRMAGTPLVDSQVLELVTAESASGLPTNADPQPWAPSPERLHQDLLAPRDRERDRRKRALEAFRSEAGVIDGFEWLDPARRRAGPAERLSRYLSSLDSIDAAEIDRRLREVRAAAQRIDYQMGALLRIGSDRRLFREIGFATVKLYVESRLGCSARRIWSLLAIERESWRRGDALQRAWREGRISPLAAFTILPVLDERTGEAWIRRAGEVTLRRLADEVAWALDHGDRDSFCARPLPPPVDADVRPGGLSSVDLQEVQMRAHGDSSRDEFGPPGGARLAFRIPISVAVLLETQLQRYRHRRDPSWRAFERVVAHAILEWTSGPKHRDPVFERDGWRCAVPGCTSRRNLHDHHVVFRSLGGDNSRGNRITVCAAHHLYLIHAGIIRAMGRSPDAIEWAMGCRPGLEPLLRLFGERYARPERATLH
jgi:hypothetical protein